MKLKTELLSFIKNTVKTAQLVGIENVIIETNKIRAIDEAKTVVLFQESNVPELPFPALGLTRIGIFSSRLALVENQDNFSVTVNLNDAETQVISLAMKGGSTKVDYRCANIAAIQAPKQVHDTLKYRVQLNPEAVMLLQKAQAAMPQQGTIEVVTILSNKDGVFFELADVTSDVFSVMVANKADILIAGETESKFVYRYPLKTILALFKQEPEGTFSVGQKGILNIIVNDINVFVLPQV